MEISAPFMAGEICLDVTGTRYCAYRNAMVLPWESVILVTNGGSVVTRSAETLSIVSLAWLEATPSAPNTGNSIPATSTPARRQRPNIFSRPSPTRTGVSVRGPLFGRCLPNCGNPFKHPGGWSSSGVEDAPHMGRVGQFVWLSSIDFV